MAAQTPTAMLVYRFTNRGYEEPYTLVPSVVLCLISNKKRVRENLHLNINQNFSNHTNSLTNMLSCMSCNFRLSVKQQLKC